MFNRAMACVRKGVSPLMRSIFSSVVIRSSRSFTRASMAGLSGTGACENAATTGIHNGHTRQERIRTARFPALFKIFLTQGSLLDTRERDGIIPDLRCAGTERVCSGAAEHSAAGMHKTAYRKTRVDSPVRVQANAHRCTGRPTSVLPTIHPERSKDSILRLNE